jgi:DNA-binding NarL/FixJ family response regulator
MQRRLVRHRITVECATTIAAAAELLRSSEASYFHATVLDLGLPDGDGAELVPMFRERGVPILVVSGSTDARLIELMRLGIFALSKPLDLDRLAGALRALLHQRATKQKTFQERYGLSDREVEVLDCVMRNLSTTKTAKRIDRKPSTVKTFRDRAFEKLGVQDRAEAVQKYLNFLDLP